MLLVSEAHAEAAGIRFFDLRVKGDGWLQPVIIGSMWLFHLPGISRYWTCIIFKYIDLLAMHFATDRDQEIHQASMSWRACGDLWAWLRYHGPMACSLTLEAALQSCAAFLLDHHSEFLILRHWEKRPGGPWMAEEKHTCWISLSHRAKDFPTRKPPNRLSHVIAMGLWSARFSSLLIMETDWRLIKKHHQTAAIHSRSESPGPSTVPHP